MSEYEEQAEQFLKKHNINLSIKYGSGKEPDWDIHGDHFRVTLSKDNPKQAIRFDFWGSQKDMQEGKIVTAYDVLACLSGDINFATPEDVFGEFGEDVYTKKQVNKIADFGAKLQDFFTSEERDDLQEIA